MGIPQELVTQAITEIIAGGNETPAVDQLMQMLEQGFQSEMQQAQEQANMGAISETDAASMEQDPTAGLDPNAVAMAEQMMGGGMPQ